MNLVQYFQTNSQEVLRLIFAHLQMTLLAVGVAILIGVPLGILISYVKKIGPGILGAANIIQAVPSLALLGFLIPFLGIGFKPAIFMVVVYSLLPIIKNTATGLSNISADINEAGVGIGLTPFQLLYKVKLPLALPVIMAGVRISAVTAVGLVTLAAFIGADGLGYLVYSGIRTVNNTQILAGAIPACLMALGMDFLLALVEKTVTPIALRDDIKNLDQPQIKKIRRRQKTGLVVVALALIVFLVASLATAIQPEKKRISIGAKDFTEQNTIASLYASLIEHNTDITVDRHLELGGTQIVFSALTNDELDMYIEYTGTLYLSILDMDPDEEQSTGEINTLISDALADDYGVSMLNPIGFNNTYAVAVRPDTAEEYNLKTISDLAKVSRELRFSPTLEFNNRADGIEGLAKLYGLEFASTQPLDGTPRYTALINDQCDVIDVTSTEALVQEYGLVVLEDDKGYFPSYNAIPLVRPEIFEAYPELEALFAKLDGQITDDDMRKMNYQVDVLEEASDDVAENFLKEKGLI